MLKADLETSIVYFNKIKDKPEERVSCSFIEVISLILLFAKFEFFNGNQFNLPKVHIFNLFKWIKIARVFVDVTRVIVGCISGNPVKEDTLSKPFRKIIEIYDTQSEANNALKSLNISS
jgi:hypothetical protein